MKKLIKLFLCTLLIFSINSVCSAKETIIIKGSDSLGAKMVPQLAESFKAKMKSYRKNVSFEIAAEGSSTGVASVIDGTSDIGMSSRDPKEKEIAKAKANGIDMKVITVAKDGIALIVNESNPLEEISIDDVEAIFSGDISDWSAIIPQSGEISAYTRNTSSGTYAVFQKLGMNSRNYGDNTQKMAGNEQIASEVSKNPFGIGYVGLAYINTPGIKVLKVEGEEPTSSNYPLSRSLYYLINANKKLSSLTNDFIGFTFSPEGQKIVKGVYFLPVY